MYVSDIHVRRSETLKTQFNSFTVEIPCDGTFHIDRREQLIPESPSCVLLSFPQAVLIVNVASHCSSTDRNYMELQALRDTFDEVQTSPFLRRLIEAQDPKVITIAFSTASVVLHSLRCIYLSEILTPCKVKVHRTGISFRNEMAGGWGTECASNKPNFANLSTAPARFFVL